MTKILSLISIVFIIFISLSALIKYELEKSKDKKANIQDSWDDSYKKAQ